MRPRRLALLSALAAALVLAAVATSLAKVQTKHVVVVKGNGFKLLAWDALDKSKSLCFLVRSGKHSSSVCAQKINPTTGINFAALQDNAQTFALVGGVARAKVKKVVVTFADGKQKTVATKAGKAYKGRKRGKVRFWAVKRAGPAPFRSVAPKTP